MKRNRLRPISRKRQTELNNERIIRQQLAERANGHCEQCGRLPDWRGLSPHEVTFRSHGGKMSLENSVMLCGHCHSAVHLIKEVKDARDKG